MPNKTENKGPHSLATEEDVDTLLAGGTKEGVMSPELKTWGSLMGTRSPRKLLHGAWGHKSRVVRARAGTMEKVQWSPEIPPEAWMKGLEYSGLSFSSCPPLS